MNLAITIIVAIVAICWVGAVVAYIFESRRERPAKSLQLREIHPVSFQRLGLLGSSIWFIISTIAILLIAPIYIIEWLVNRQSRRKV